MAKHHHEHEGHKGGHHASHEAHHNAHHVEHHHHYKDGGPIEHDQVKHQPRARGGRSRLDMKVSGNPDVFQEAAEKKKGGRTKKHHEKKAAMKMEGKHPRHRMDRPGRKKGGRVGADSAPLSTAHKTSKTEEFPKTQEGGASD